MNAVLQPTQTFVEFAEAIRLQTAPLIDPESFAVRMGLEMQELAALAGVHRNTIRTHPQSRALQEFLRDSIRVISAASNVSGGGEDVERALYWFRNHPIADYSYRTAESLVAEHKTEAVLAYLDTLEGGATG